MSQEHVPATAATERIRACRSRSLPACGRDAGHYPDLPRKQRETAILQEYPAVFIIGIGWTLKDGYPHEMRAADYDDWVHRTLLRRRTPDARVER